jgi:IS30 family transposase
MDRRSNPLGSEERGVIFAGHERGRSQRAIGRLPGRPASTIGRALARGRRADGRYGPQAARRAHDTRRARCGRRRKLAEGSALYRFVHDHLVFWRWSPEQIAHRLRRMKPDDPSARVSHETIYAARAAARRAEGGDDRGPAPGQTVARPPAHHADRQRHRSGLIADYPPARGDRGPAGARPLGMRRDRGPCGAA